METRIEIQGRRRVRRRGGAVRDEVRHARPATVAEAWEIAQQLAAEGFTVWIFEVGPGPGVAPRYNGIGTLTPDVATARCAA